MTNCGDELFMVRGPQSMTICGGELVKVRGPSQILDIFMCGTTDRFLCLGVLDRISRNFEFDDLF